MRWSNHVVMAAAPAALVAPALVPVVALGATAPDWLEWVSKALGHPVRHRGPTHYLALWALAAAFFFSVADFRGVGLAFTLGGLSHVLADALTVTGVPFSPLSDRRFHLFGGRLRTGGVGEFGLAWGTVAAVAVLAMLLRGWGGGGYLPFFPDWASRYERGVATAKEWRDNRFRLF